MEFLEKKGCIALDIDGTLTADFNTVPDPVVDCLNQIHKRGYKILFLTGRTWTLAARTLSKIPFDHYFAVQNGSDIVKMPSKTLIHRTYLDPEIIHALDEIYAHEKEDFIIYSGFDLGDFCYYRPERFSPRIRKYLSMLEEMTGEPWKRDFSFPKSAAFPLIKCFGDAEEVWRVYKKLQHLPVNATVIKDPLDPDLYLILVTHPKANKGEALEFLLSEMDIPNQVIAAGDDLNDVSMLKKATIKIVMNTAPASMLPMADIVAASAAEYGIINALWQAIDKLETSSWS